MNPEPSVLATRVLGQQVRHLKDFFEQASSIVDDPPSRSPAAEDLALVHGARRSADLQALRWWAHRAVRLDLSSALEHQFGLQVILANEQRLLPLPAMALGRSIYEAAISVFWLVDTRVPTQQRLARWAGRLLHDTQESPNALESFGISDVARVERERVEDGRALGQRLMRRAGFELVAKGGDRSAETRQVSFEGQVSRLVPNVTDLVPTFTPNQQSLWPLFSGASHNRGWLVAGLEGNAAEMLASIVAPLLDTSDALVIECAKYFHLDPRSALDRTHLHRQAVLKLARPHSGPSLDWEAYRVAGGAPPVAFDFL